MSGKRDRTEREPTELLKSSEKQLGIFPACTNG